jgi:phosphate:Na+ symporter
MHSLADILAQLRREQRPAVISQTALGQHTPSVALRLLDGYRWLDRVGHHVWRACEYLTDEPPPTDPPA